MIKPAMMPPRASTAISNDQIISASCVELAFAGFAIDPLVPRPWAAIRTR